MDLFARVAAIYDIHGNLPALEAVVEEIRREHVDSIVVGGDVVLGPMSRESVACLLHLDIPTQFIKGNCEIAVLEEMAGGRPAVPEKVLETVQWTARELKPNFGRVLAGWPATLHCRITGLGDILFCHATPRNENEIFTKLTPEEHLVPVFEGLGVDAVVCGHTHMQFDRKIRDVRVVNAGSVGMPFGAAGAAWVLLGPSVQLRRTPYNVQQAAERILGTTYPQAREFTGQYVLNRPSEVEMLRAYGRIEIGAPGNTTL
jgi:predicted phosphodiesterase